MDMSVWALAGAALVLLLVPSLIVIAISFSELAYVRFPPTGFTLRWYGALLEDRQLADAALVSLRIATAVTILTLLLSLPAAYALVRGRRRGRLALTALMTAPQMMPGMVIGIALLYWSTGFAIDPSTMMTVLGLTVFVFPFSLRILAARIAGIDPVYEKASGVLGAGGLQTAQYVLLPQVSSAVLGAAALVFIEAFDNITVVLFTSSPRERPLAVELYGLVQFDSSPKVAAVCSLEIVMALVTMTIISLSTGLEGLWGKRSLISSLSDRPPSITSRPPRPAHQ